MQTSRTALLGMETLKNLTFWGQSSGHSYRFELSNFLRTFPVLCKTICRTRLSLILPYLFLTHDFLNWIYWYYFSNSGKRFLSQANLFSSIFLGQQFSARKVWQNHLIAFAKYTHSDLPLLNNSCKMDGAGGSPGMWGQKKLSW